MKSLFKNNVIFYLTFFAKIKHELPVFTEDDCLERLTQIFPLTQEERLSIVSIFENEDWQALKTADEVEFHLKMLDVLGDCEGVLFNDKSALLAKQSALKVAEETFASAPNAIMFLQRNAYKQRVAMLIHSVYTSIYGKGIVQNPELMSVLKKTAMSTSYKFCDVEAAIIALYNEPCEAQRYIRTLERAELHSDELEKLKNKYFKEEKKYDTKFS